MAEPNSPQPTALDEVMLRHILENHDIDPTEWGVGATKTVRHLLREVLAGEMLLKEEQGTLLRELRVANVNVFRDGPHGRQRLIETKQVFTNGDERVRNGDERESVSEKMTVYEDPVAAADRALREELHIEGEFTIQLEGIDEKNISSPSYPGLTSTYILHRFSVMLDPTQAKDEYQEVQKDKTTYFHWSE